MGIENQINRELFSTEIARTYLNPSQKEKDIMFDYFKELTELQGDQKTSTGDVMGTGALHLKPEFAWLTKKVEEQVILYLDNLGVKTESLSFFHQKSWPVVNKDGGCINTHNHPNAAISVVYYLNTESDKGGNLLFSRDVPLFSGSIKGLSFLTKKSKYNYGIKPKNNMLVIFPSSTVHEVLEYKSNSPRWSVTYDIIATSKPTLGAGKTENTIVHPIFWKEFQVTQNIDFETNKKIEKSLTHNTYKNKQPIGDSFCNAVFTEIVSKWNTVNPTLLNAEKLIQKTNLVLSDSVIALLKKLAKIYKEEILENCDDYQNLYLSELVSITSFPGSEKYKFSKETKHPKKHICFWVNLLTSDNLDYIQIQTKDEQASEGIINELSNNFGSNLMIKDIDYQLNIFPNNSNNGIISLFNVVFEEDFKNTDDKNIMKEYIGKYYLKDFL